MNCPICNAWTSVNETLNRGDYTKRRRECANGHKFTTEERLLVKKVAASTKIKEEKKP